MLDSWVNDRNLAKRTQKSWWMEANSGWVSFERVRRITRICQTPINQQSTFPCQATVWSWRMGQWFAVLTFTVTCVKVAVIPWSLLLVCGAWSFGPLDCCHQDCRGVRHKSLMGYTRWHATRYALGWSPSQKQWPPGSSHEPCCKLSCIVSCIEVTFTQGFEGFTWKTIGDALKNDTPKTYM